MLLERANESKKIKKIEMKIVLSHFDYAQFCLRGGEGKGSSGMLKESKNLVAEVNN